jgi:hypothetical protein
MHACEVQQRVSRASFVGHPGPRPWSIVIFIVVIANIIVIITVSNIAIAICIVVLIVTVAIAVVFVTVAIAVVFVTVAIAVVIVTVAIAVVIVTVMTIALCAPNQPAGPRHCSSSSGRPLRTATTPTWSSCTWTRRCVPNTEAMNERANE